MPKQNSSYKNPICSSSMHIIYMECKTSMILLLLLSIPLHMSRSATCSSSVSNINAINTQIQQFSESNTNYNSYIYGSAQGPISRNLYFLYNVYSSPYYTSIRRVNVDNSLVWIKTVSSYYPYVNSLVVDSAEQYAYCTLNNGGFIVRFSANNGNIVDAKKFNLNYLQYDSKISLLSDNSGYYIPLYNSQNYY